MEELDLKEQLNVLKIALNAGKDQIEKLGVELNSKKYDTRTIDEKKSSLRTEGFYLYSKNFWGQYEFLCEKIEVEKNENMHFYIPSLRILTELYAESLFFLNQDIRTTIGILVGNYLIYYADNYNYLSRDTIISDEYNRYMALAQDVLDNEGIVFPSDITKLSHGYLKTSGFSIERYEEIFKKKYFAQQSKESFGMWSKDNSTDFYNKYYRTHSNYTHRNFTNQTDANVGTEVFWIVQFMILIAQLMLELSNLKYFNNSYKSVYTNFSSQAQTALNNMHKDWVARKPATLPISS